MDKDAENRAASGNGASSSEPQADKSAAMKKYEGVAPKKKTKRRKKKPYPISLNLSNCKYEVVRIVQKKLGWKEVGDEDDWQVYWTDTSVSIERIMRLKKTQKINHFTGMLEICRKKSLAKNLGKMSKLFPDDFKFVPRSYTLPAELPEFLAQFSSKKKKTFILKPDSGCQGKGICLAQSADSALKALQDNSGENVVAQRYLAKPYLIDGMKFDLRVYVLVVSCDPLRIFIYEEGLARFCTEKYCPPSDDNLDQVCMHLTNYAVNKHNDKFCFNDDADNDDSGSKWSISGLREYLSANGEDFEAAWVRIQDLTVKTLISIQPILQHNYRSVLPEENDGFSCFELLGLDVMLDHKLKPWLIEVNHSPSFTVDTPLDLAIKEDLISDTIELVGVDPKVIKKQKEAEREDARNRLYGGAPGVKEKPAMSEEEQQKFRSQVLAMREKYEAKHMGGFTLIFPNEDESKNEHFSALLEGSAKTFKESVHHKVRDTLAKVKEERAKRLQAEENANKMGTMGRPPPRAGEDRARPAEEEGEGSGMRRIVKAATDRARGSEMWPSRSGPKGPYEKGSSAPRRLVGIPRLSQRASGEEGPPTAVRDQSGMRPARLPSSRLGNLTKPSSGEGPRAPARELVDMVPGTTITTPLHRRERHSSGVVEESAVEERRRSLDAEKERARTAQRGAEGLEGLPSSRGGPADAASDLVVMPGAHLALHAGKDSSPVSVSHVLASSAGPDARELGSMGKPFITHLPGTPQRPHAHLVEAAPQGPGHSAVRMETITALDIISPPPAPTYNIVTAERFADLRLGAKDVLDGLLSTSGLAGDGKGRVDIHGDLREVVGLTPPGPKGSQVAQLSRLGSGKVGTRGPVGGRPLQSGSRPRSVDSQASARHQKPVPKLVSTSLRLQPDVGDDGRIDSSRQSRLQLGAVGIGAGLGGGSAGGAVDMPEGSHSNPLSPCQPSSPTVHSQQRSTALDSRRNPPSLLPDRVNANSQRNMAGCDPASLGSGSKFNLQRPSRPDRIAIS